MRKLAIDSIVLNHLKYVLNYRQVRSDKKVEVFKEISYKNYVKNLKNYEIVKTNVAKGINEILNNIKDRIDDLMPDLRYELGKTPWAESILYSFTLTPKILLEYDHGDLIKFSTLIDRELNSIKTKIQKLFDNINEITENKENLIRILKNHNFKKVYNEFETIYSKRLKINKNEEEIKVLENFLKNYENLSVDFDKTDTYFTIDVKVSGKEITSELKGFLDIIDQFFEENK